MLGKTHMVVGAAASLVLLQPSNLTELVLGTGAAVIGSVISDIDSGNSGSHKDANKIIVMMVTAVALIAGVEYFFHVGIGEKLMRYSSGNRMVMSAIAFFAICLFGKSQPHRSFMHSVLALLLLDGCLTAFLPMLVPYFDIGFLLHLALDFLNRKGEMLLYPMKKRFSMGLCKSSGLVNRWLFTAGTVVSTGTFLWLLAKILHVKAVM